ncbi:MAG: hypothetical protein R2708_24590 [Vicinamibacterales bacterium]
MAHGEAAARAERQVVAQADVLLEQLRQLVDGGSRRLGQRPVADGQPRDLPGRRQIALQVRGGERQARRDVVEAVVGLVGQQQRRCVDLERQDVADSVGILGAVQAMGPDSRRLRMRLGGAIERVGDGAHDRARFGRLRSRTSGWRHLPAAHLVATFSLRASAA